MGGVLRVVVLVTFVHISQSVGVHHSLPLQDNFSDEDLLQTGDNIIEPVLENKLSPISAMEDAKIQRLGNYLAYILSRPWPQTGLPLLYVEDYPNEEMHYNQPMLPEDFEDVQHEQEHNADETAQVPFKRSRYYRKYPWKRQNTYEAENRYLCQPSKDDVFRLLVALHEARQGNRDHSIHFCNRKRPATAIFTNIRFLGKRK